MATYNKKYYKLSNEHLKIKKDISFENLVKIIPRLSRDKKPLKIRMKPSSETKKNIKDELYKAHYQIGSVSIEKNCYVRAAIDKANNHVLEQQYNDIDNKAQETPLFNYKEVETKLKYLQQQGGFKRIFNKQHRLSASYLKRNSKIGDNEFIESTMENLMKFRTEIQKKEQHYYEAVSYDVQSVFKGTENYGFMGYLKKVFNYNFKGYTESMVIIGPSFYQPGWHLENMEVDSVNLAGPGCLKIWEVYDAKDIAIIEKEGFNDVLQEVRKISFLCFVFSLIFESIFLFII